jgi:hypothetical protein
MSDVFFNISLDEQDEQWNIADNKCFAYEVSRYDDVFKILQYFKHGQQ